MEINEKKNKIQDAAVETWIYSGKKGTVEAITGIGKMFIFLKALLTMPRNQQDTVHLFLAETTARDRDLQEQITIFNKIYNVDVLAMYNLQFHCYQEVYKWKQYKLGLVGCDEIHEQLTPAYILFHLNNKCDAVIGLTALLLPGPTYNIKRDIPLRNYFGKDLVTKIDMVNKIAPVCFTYTVNQGQQDETSRKLNIYVIKHQLNKTIKNHLGGSVHAQFYQTEASAYSYLTKVFNDAINLEQKKDEDWFKYEERRELKIIQASNKRSQFLYNILSKVAVVKILLANIKTKSIIFSTSLESLKKMTHNIVSSHNTDAVNESILNNFSKNIISVIGSFKKLVQGANLPDLDNCIIASYYSSEVKLIQMMGRLRQNKDKIGNVFIIVTQGTQEVIWFNKMIKDVTDYNIIYCENAADCITKYKQNNEE